MTDEESLQGSGGIGVWFPYGKIVNLNSLNYCFFKLEQVYFVIVCLSLVFCTETQLFSLRCL